MGSEKLAMKTKLTLSLAIVHISDCLAVTTDPLSANVPQVGEDYDGMMDALVDIQEKGDNMMAGIWWQKEILEKLEGSLAEAEVRMEAAEKRNEALDLAKLSLEAEVAELEAKREQVISRMSSEEQQVVRTSSELGPLEKRLLSKKNELKSLTLDLTAKQRQLESFKEELTSSSKTTVGLNTTPLPILALLAISLLVNVVVGVALADTVITADSRKEIQKFGHNWLGTVLTQSKQRQKTKKRQTETKEKQHVKDLGQKEKKVQ